MIMRRFVFRCLLIAVPMWGSVPVWAQPAVMRELMDDVSTVEAKVVALAKAVPVGQLIAYARSNAITPPGSK
jgi:hypothetical protein